MGLLHSVLTRLFPPQAEPLSEIRPGDAAMIQGRVIARDILTSPLTGERCVYYQYTIEQWRASRVAGVGSDGFWELHETDEAIAEFYVQDSAARAIIAPQRAQIERGRGVTGDKVPMDVAFQRAQQLLITPDDIVEITGIAERARDLHDEERAYRSSVHRIMISAPKNQPLRIRLVKRANR